MRLIYCLLTSIILLSSVSGARSSETVFVVDGMVVEVTQPPVFRTDDVLVWIGDLARLGWVTITDARNGKLVVKHEAVTLTFHNKQSIANINNLVVETTAPAEIISGRFMVPFGFICKALGFSCSAKEAIIIETVTSPKPVTSAAVKITGPNSIEGKVMYGGQPVAGVKVRAINERGQFIPEITGISDYNGSYVLVGLPDGNYRPYVYIGDNPDYFNRVGETVELKDGLTTTAPAINLGLVLRPISPEQGANIPAGIPITLEWTECPHAEKYIVTVADYKTGSTVFTTVTHVPSVDVPSKNLPKSRYIWSITALSKSGEFLGGSPACERTPWTFSVADDTKMQNA